MTVMEQLADARRERLRRRLLYEDRQRWRLPLLWVASRAEARRLGAEFSNIARYMMFLGYPRSGHSLLGSMINAHPEALVAHETHALRYVQYGFSRAQIFALLVRRDREFGRLGRRWSGYDYTIPGQWQGTWRKLVVIGDKRGGASSRLLQRKPHLLDELRRRVGLPLRIFHHVRNPFDNIARMALVSGADLSAATDRYFRNVDWAKGTIERLGREELMHVFHEQLVADPQGTLRAMLEHLGLDADPDYLDTCARHVMSSPSRSRDRVEWPDWLVRDVQRRIDAHDHLAGYSFEY